MNTVIVSSTKLKNDISNILNDVCFGKKIAVIKRYGKVIAKIVPVIEEKKGVKDINALLDKYFGIAPDFPDVTEKRFFRKRSVGL